MGKRKLKIVNKTRFIIAIIILLVIIFVGIYALLTKISGDDVVETSAPLAESDIPETPIIEDKHISMSVIGDIMCHNSQYTDAYVASSDTYDFSYVFEDIKQYIEPADIAIGNIETTFAGKERGYSNYPTFNSPEQLATNLKDLGIDVLCTANNHSLDKVYS